MMGSSRRADTALAVSLASANLIVLLSCWKTVGVQVDESLYIYGALEMLRGKLIYKDFWLLQGPGILFLNMATMALLGKSLFAVRLVLILGACAATAVLYLLGRQLMTMIPAAIVALLFVALGVNVWPIVGHHWHSTFFLIFSAYSIVGFLRNPARTHLLVLGGLLAGITLLFQQHKGVALIAGATFFFLCTAIGHRLKNRGSLQSLTRPAVIFLLCSLLPVTLCALYFLKVGTLSEAVSATIVFPYRYLAGFANPNFGAHYGAFAKEMLGNLLRFFSVPVLTNVSLQTAVSMILVAVPLSIPMVPAILLWKKRSVCEDSGVPMFISIAALASYGASLGRPDFHHLLTVTPPGYLTLIYAIVLLTSSAAPDAGRSLRKALATVRYILLAVVTIPALWIGTGVLVYAFRVEMLSLGSPLAFFPIVSENRAALRTVSSWELLVNFIRTNTSPEDKIFTMPFSPFLYYLTERENATKYPMLIVSTRSPEQMAEVVAELEQDRTRWVILDPAASWRQFKAALPYADEKEFRDNLLLRYIHTNYRKTADYGGFVLMERLGTDQPR